MKLDIDFYDDVKILDFDLENRPLTYAGRDWNTAEITAIAWGWNSNPDNIQCLLLGEDSEENILREFVSVYESADLVTGHYIRNHDLPILNGCSIEYGLGPLPDKLTQDTKLDLTTTFPAVSASQENLSALLGLREQKFHMNQVMWREANRLTPKGLGLTRNRVIQDVREHMELRNKLLDRDLLRQPKIWRP